MVEAMKTRSSDLLCDRVMRRWRDGVVWSRVGEEDGDEGSSEIVEVGE